MPDLIEELKLQIKALENRQATAQLWFFQDKINLLRLFTEKMGPCVIDILTEYIRTSTIQQWQEIARSMPDPTLIKYLDILWNQMGTPEGFEFSMETKNEAIQMHVTKCPLAERAIQCGAQDWGYRLYCMTDYASTEGFNPEIEFSRTKTLMEGHDCCDHTYRMKKSRDSPK